jgi:pimeloyl-ACP methyl ester carboxylesterase
LKINRRDFMLMSASAAIVGPAFGRMDLKIQNDNSRELGSFHIEVPALVIEDLKERLRRTRWNDAVQPGWTYGTDRGFLVQLIDYWLKSYDWAAREVMLNGLPHRYTQIDGFGIHYLHFHGMGASPRPLLLMNGWPSSFIEYTKLAPMLADPASYGADSATAFDVVIPALPGFGFSDRPTAPHQVDAVELFAKLMTKTLGYARFYAAGTDIGAGVATRLALRYPESVAGIHIAAVVDPPMTVGSAPLSPAETAFREEQQKWDREEGAYQSLQSTRPQTLAFGLADSPAGLASWICEKFYNWSDCHGDVLSVFPMETLIDNLMVYWVTGTIGSSVRYYYEARHFRAPLKPGDHVSVPTGVIVLPKDLERPPREWIERFYNLRSYSILDRGGHFPGWEVPNDYARTLRAFAQSVTLSEPV